MDLDDARKDRIHDKLQTILLANDVIQSEKYRCHLSTFGELDVQRLDRVKHKSICQQPINKEKKLADHLVDL